MFEIRKSVRRPSKSIKKDAPMAMKKLYIWEWIRLRFEHIGTLNSLEDLH